MDYDGNKRLLDVDKFAGGSPGRIAHDIESAQKSMTPGSKTRKWARRLRFLIDVRNSPQKNPDYPDHDFELITDNIDAVDPYVAVSYCWRARTQKFRASEARVLRILVPLKEGGMVVRDARARSEVLLRTFKYANAHGIRKVWIDQECIDQNDRVDKENGIQSMDLVYRQAGVTLVLLDRHVLTMQDTDALALTTRLRDYSSWVKPKISREAERQLREGMVERIMGDKWFTRAWTTQEFMVSTADSLMFLIGWEEEEELEKAWELLSKAQEEAWEPAKRGEFLFSLEQTVRGEWLLNLKDVKDLVLSLQVATDFDEEPGSTASMVNFLLEVGGNQRFRLERNDHYTLPEVDVAELEYWKVVEEDTSAEAEDEAAETPKSLPSLRISPNDNYFDTFLIPALNTLNYKANSRTADKIAILGNLTEYQWRLNTMIAEEKNLSFSACALALALYNGDTSPLFSFSTAMSDNIREDGGDGLEWMYDYNADLSNWLPDQTVGLESLVITHSYHARTKPKGGRSCLVRSGKLIMEGLVWKVQPFHDLQFLQEEIREYHDFIQKNMGRIDWDSDDFHFSCFQSIVRGLFELGRTDILEVVVARAMTYRLHSPAQLITQMMELEDWFYGRKEWPTGDKATGLNFFRTLTMQWMCGIIAEGKPLPLGVCETEEDTIVSLFKTKTEDSEAIFTPLCHLPYEFWMKREKRLRFNMSPALSWNVRIREGEVEKLEVDKVTEILESAESTGGVAEVGEGGNVRHEVFVSSKNLEIMSKPIYVEGYWSPRVSDAGMLMPIPESKSWTINSFGDQAAFYFFQ